MVKYIWHMAALAAIWVAQPPIAMAADEAVQKEYIVKAAFIYNFVKFVEWPGALEISKQQHINICVIHDNPFNDGALDVFQRASTARLALSVVDLHGDLARLSMCHILFFPRTSTEKQLETVASLQNKPVLTVGEAPQFAKYGGMIEFGFQDGKVKLIVNPGAATKAGLRVDAQLLEIAMQVIK